MRLATFGWMNDSNAWVEAWLGMSGFHLIAYPMEVLVRLKKKSSGREKVSFPYLARVCATYLL